MPGNQWGNALPGFDPQFFFPISDTVCNAATETTFSTTTNPLIAPGPGRWYPKFTGYVAISFGATLPGVLTVRSRIHGGSTISSQAINLLAAAANGTLYLPWVTIGVPSGLNWYPNGLQVDFNCTADTQAVTVRQTGSFIIAEMFRGADA